MDHHRSITFPTNKPVVLNYHHYNNNNNNITSNRNKPTLLKKSNILINSSFISESNHSNNNIGNEETQNYDFPKSRPISAASRPISAASRPKIMQKNNNYDKEIFTRFRLMTQDKTNQINEMNESTRPQSDMKNCWQAPGPVIINNVALGVNLPNNKPTLLERYWKYNKIKKGEVLTNRCYDSDDGRYFNKNIINLPWLYIYLNLDFMSFVQHHIYKMFQN
jgi:hypothetical protein